MDQQIADRHLRCDVRIRQTEPRQILNNRRVPLELAFVDERSQRRCGEDFRVGRDAEERLVVNHRRLADRLHAVALRGNDRAVFDDGDGQRKGYNHEGP